MWDSLNFDTKRLTTLWGYLMMRLSLRRKRKELLALPTTIQDQIINKLELLRDFPQMGPAMFDAFEGYRALLVARNTYRVIYRIVSDDVIEIAYIRRCARQTRLRIIRRS